MRTQVSLWIHASLAGLAMVGLGGCASAPGDQTDNPSEASAPVTGAGPRVELRNGMTPGEVRQLLGEPTGIKPVTAPEGTAGTWIYERGKKTVVKQVVAGTQEMPYFDPITNQMRTIPEPVYADEATVITEELHLFWHDDVLVQWTTEFRANRSYTR